MSRIIKIYVINKAIKWNTAQDTDSLVARHDGATHFMVLLNLKGDKMKTYSAEELKEILDNHRRWLYGYDGIKERADLRGANLYGADLYGANLCGADLCGANLCDADLRDANLCDADLRGANLRGADLRGANLRGADLRGADLCDADLCGADLYGADLYGADLRGADLRGLNGNLRHIKSIQTETYYITYTSKVIQIGCQRHTIEEWKNFDDEKIKRMDSKALNWWNKWKPILMQIIELAPCEETK